ncbi:MAG TPA: glutamine synthetase family protein [Symbiobacteriaceae bacterium]|nr:glutamine synthetase family protein [Symbiobacteriaceae bacterium]
MGNAAQGNLSVAEFRQLVADGAVDTVIIAVCDMQGRLMGKRVRADHYVAHCLEHGVHFCVYLLGTDMEMNTPDGYQLMNWETGYGDWLARPDYATLRLIPWLQKSALVLADAADETSGNLVEIAPRSILRRQLARAEALGLHLKMASELEFYLLNDTYESARGKGFQNLDRHGWYNEDYHLLQGTKAEPLYRTIRNAMTEAGVPIEGSKGEAAPGQHEMNIRFAGALEAADRHALFKHGAKEMALQAGKAITFMAKPDQTWTGSSSHIHISAWDAAGDRNLFHDSGAAPYDMSRTMRHFLGGLMASARELSLFWASTINAYKRYAVASWAPVNIVWGRDNRTCGFRVVGHGDSLRIENRFPGADANPYLAYAAVIAGGLYGIEHEIEAPDECRGNGYVARGAARIPRSLYEAIGVLSKGRIARAAFGDSVVDHYLNMARVEQEAYDAAVTTWERERYLERS